MTLTREELIKLVSPEETKCDICGQIIFGGADYLAHKKICSAKKAFDDLEKAEEAKQAKKKIKEELSKLI